MTSSSVSSRNSRRTRLIDRWVTVLVLVDEAGSELALDPRYRVSLEKASGAVKFIDASTGRHRQA